MKARKIAAQKRLADGAGMIKIHLDHATLPAGGGVTTIEEPMHIEVVRVRVMQLFESYFVYQRPQHPFPS